MPTRIGKQYLPIGIDLGHTGVRGIQLVRRGKSICLHSALEASFADRCAPADPTDRTDPPDDSIIINALERLMERGGFVGSEAIIHCPADKLDLRPLDLPSVGRHVPRSAVLGALRLQMGSHLPFSVEDAVFDYYWLDQSGQGNGDKAMAVTADGPWIRRRIRLAEAAGLHCIAIDALPCVLARVGPAALFKNQNAIPDTANQEDAPRAAQADSEMLLAVVDIGFSGSTLVVLNPQGPFFCRRFSLGGCEMTDILTQRLGVDFKRAELLKRFYGLDCHPRRLRDIGLRPERTSRPAAQAAATGPATAQSPAVGRPTTGSIEIAKAIYAALQNDLGHFVKGLTRSLNYIISSHGGARLDKILLCGSAAHTKNLGLFLEQQFERPVDMITHPLLDEITRALPASRAQPGRWATALGLALSKARDSKW